MLIVVPDWVTKARKQIDHLVDDIIAENHIDWTASHDSIDLEKSKELIGTILWRIHGSVNVQHREWEEKNDKEVQKLFKNMKKKKRSKGGKSKR